MPTAFQPTGKALTGYNQVAREVNQPCRKQNGVIDMMLIS